MAVNINVLFIAILSLLVSVLIFLRPLETSHVNDKEVAQLELKNLTMYELNTTQVKVVVNAKFAKRFSDRYELHTFRLDENSDKVQQHLSAKSGIYKDNFVHLEENVHYQRDDGLALFTDIADYNQTSSMITTESNFTIVKNSSYISGSRLKYYLHDNSVQAENISVKYNMKEKVY